MRFMLLILIIGDEIADYLKDILPDLSLNRILVSNFDY